MKLRVFVVDDTIVFRTILIDILKSIDDVEVVGSAASGRVAIAKILELKPDLVTLDIEMPGMNGIEVLEQIRVNKIDTGVLVVSSFTASGSSYTIQALEKGAFDFITKPSDETPEKNRILIRNELLPRIKTFQRKLEIHSILHRNESVGIGIKKTVHQNTECKTPSTPHLNENVKLMGRPEMVLIGVSTGGPAALARLIPQIPEDFNVPVFIVQHMPPMFTGALAESLESKSKIKVVEAANNTRPLPGYAYIAPGGKQMKLVKDSDSTKMIIINDDPPENNCKPAVDYFFRSVANNFPSKSVAVILTGMGSDGTVGLRMLKRQGCQVIAQDEASCVVFGMPRSAIEAGVVDEILTLEKITPRIIEIVRWGTF
ncbi:MAG TPA: chemotaxis response regulator protein-glutamate methylesterase [Chitinispirillaceae bacterium]|nr:chemotaxis response regulator protein-glutamate methylesterase [Chitinispirillaceae bacterium]